MSAPVSQGDGTAARRNDMTRYSDITGPIYGAWVATMSLITLGLSAALFARFRPGARLFFGPLRNVYLYDMLVSLAALIFSLWLCIPRISRRAKLIILTIMTLLFLAAFGWTEHQHYYNAWRFRWYSTSTALVVFLGLIAFPLLLFWLIDMTLYLWRHRHHDDRDLERSKYPPPMTKEGPPPTTAAI
ncbi:SubName: Full=Uncharacterized protein {ECO:0000313/EMBL:CCA76072.1} [Serendipita indica DSM 11827]|uniref:Uncharacterized protein n=1 Tax=Serendipita indica (strain DSM 11827) TaxID=1109443 RepID=G4TXM9_SERID|nr:SubName: Full=Uncharacterized protein {ECO:0000313/EMBL:CCA76072.1} [Serendipita indica DSM 11827]CCA76072.1 hypothetical protein PIIN_10072 [Serendipita indica DSM 11827]